MNRELPLRAVNPISGSHWNAGFRPDFGPSRGDPCRPAFRPNLKFKLTHYPLPVAVRDGGPQSPSVPAASMPSSEIGGSAGLVDEDEFRWIKIGLAGEPVPALLQNVRAPLLRSVRENNLLTRTPSYVLDMF